MADKLGAAMAWLASKLKAKVSVTGTYRRGAASVSLAVTLGSQILQSADERTGLVKVERTELDVVFSTADLVLSGVATTPLAGDTLDLTFGSSSWRFTAMSMSKSERCWRYQDASRAMIHLHLKETGAA